MILSSGGCYNLLYGVDGESNGAKNSFQGLSTIRIHPILYGSRADAMLEGFGSAFNLFPNDDHLLEMRLKQLIDDRFGTYLDWAMIGEPLWDAVDDFRDALDEEQLAELESRFRNH